MVDRNDTGGGRKRLSPFVQTLIVVAFAVLNFWLLYCLAVWLGVLS